ncbi:hypothetical protein EUGRSUZ_C03334 [Eucalyptus grandis]|uniref:Uncharacterized protein n=1 Tax=Eucalyptus grandis TaxID=71139 RepID=A0ACC3LI00_EUCGR|nr:hypothetical protein EUGRSUZ_C03334 [Eucalyptus grandis]
MATLFWKLRWCYSEGAPRNENFEEEVDEPYYRLLLQAAFKGDWEFATGFFQRDAASKTAKITSRSETLLHIAALSARDQFLENLVELLYPNPEALEMVDCDDRTALHNAVLCGRIRMVKTLVRSNPKLTQLADKEGRVPLQISALEASMHKDITWFLAKSTTDDGPSHPFSSPAAIETLVYITDAGHHDITLYLAGRYPHILTMKRTKIVQGSVNILFALAMMESYFRSGTRLNVVEALIYRFPMIKRIYEVKMRHKTSVELAERILKAMSQMKTTEIPDFFLEEGPQRNPLAQATAKGNSEIVKLCIQYFPKLFVNSPSWKSLITCAIEYRQERILNLFLKLSSTAELSLVLGPRWDDSENMIKAAASYYPSFDARTKVAGAAFRMQREIQYMRTAYIERGTDDRAKSYWTRFVENHQNLLENGEKWIKDTSNSCMLVSTLIATVLFAAAFTIPGGNDSNTGVPLLLGQDSLLVFAISDSLGLFSSVTAILLFLAILTLRYEARDFLYSLPKKIIMGLVFLFLSLAFMLVVFAATLTILLDKRLDWVLIPIILLTTIPVALFLVLQLPLLYQMIKSTYGRSIFRPENIW